MKSLIPAPAAIAAAALCGWILCRAAGWNLNSHSLIAAAIVAILASEAAIVPALLAARSDPPTVMQAALFGMVGHLLAILALAGLALVSRLSGPMTPFVYWLSAFYWASLIAVAMVLARMIRAATHGQRQVGGK